jgi:quinol monooxygenase YgiN
VIVISGRITIRPEQRDRAVEGALRMAAASRAEDGCQEYRFSADLADPNVFYLFECWENPEAMTTHMASTHMADFMKLAGDVVGGPFEATRFEVSSSGPLF